MDPELVSREIGDFIVDRVTRVNATGGIVGLSGGVDSTVVAALTKKAFDRYNITNEKWLEKERFVYPTYPDECTDDLEYIAKHNCTHMLWPKHLDRDVNYPFSVLPYSQQEAYWPDSNFGPYWDIKPKDFDQNPYTVDKKTGKKIYNKKLQFDNFPQKGRPMFPYAATGPMQYVKPFVYSFNSTHNGTFYEHCTSAYGEPTRGKITDGKGIATMTIENERAINFLD